MLEPSADYELLVCSGMHVLKGISKANEEVAH